MTDKNKDLLEGLYLLWQLRVKLDVLEEIKSILSEYVCEYAKREECDLGDGDEGELLSPLDQGDGLIKEIMIFLEEKAK